MESILGRTLVSLDTSAVTVWGMLRPSLVVSVECIAVTLFKMHFIFYTVVYIPGEARRGMNIHIFCPLRKIFYLQHVSPIFDVAV